MIIWCAWNYNYVCYVDVKMTLFFYWTWSVTNTKKINMNYCHLIFQTFYIYYKAVTVVWKSCVYLFIIELKVSLYLIFFSCVLSTVCNIVSNVLYYHEYMLHDYLMCRNIIIWVKLVGLKVSLKLRRKIETLIFLIQIFLLNILVYRVIN